MFDFDLSEEFKKTTVKIAKKNPVIADSINKKIKEIILKDKQSTAMYKNLRHDLKNLKRIHITSWLVMTFEVDLNKNFILFVKIAHRDDVYKK